MPITLVVGLDPATRRRLALETVSQCDGAHTLVCRTQASAHELGRALSREDRPAWTPVHSWRRWVEDLWATSGDGRTPVDAAVRGLLISQIADERVPFGAEREVDLLDKVGGRRLAADLVSRYSGAQLRGTHRSAGYEALFALAGEYIERTESQGYIEFAEIITQLSELVRERGGGPQAVGLVGFTTLTPDEQRLLESIGSSGAHVVIELPYSGTTDATRVNGSLIDELVASSDATVLHADEVGQHPGAILASLVGGLSEGVPSREVVDSLGRGDFTLSVGEGVDAETCLIGDLVEDEIAHGVSGDKIAVVVNNIKANAHRLAGELERRGIPYSVSADLLLAATGFGTAMVQLLDVAEALEFAPALPGAPVIGPFLASAYSGMRGADASALDARTRYRRRSVSSVVGDIAHGSYDHPGYGRSSALGRLWDLPKRAGDSATVAVTWKLIADTVLANGQSAVQQTWWGTAQDTKAHAAFAEIIATLQDAGTPLTAANIRSQVRQSTVSVTPPANAAGLVLVASPGAVVGRELDVLVLAGQSAGEAGGAMAAVRADQRIAQQVGIAPAVDAVGERMIRDVAVLSSGLKRIHLVWRALDEMGGHVEPSPLLEELLFGMGIRPTTLHAALRRVNQLRQVAGEMADTEWATLLAQLIGLDRVPEAEAERAVLAAKHSRYHGLGSPEVSAVRSSAHRDRVPEYEDPTAHAPVNAPRGAVRIQYPSEHWEGRYLSPSAIEAYSRCPYRWFLERHVRARSLDDDYSAASAGEAIHEVLERFYVRWTRAEKRGPLSEETLAEARVLFDVVKAQVLDEELEKLSASWESRDYGAIVVDLELERAWRVIVNDARGKLYPKGSRAFAPRYFEWKFGPDAIHEDAVVSEERELDTYPAAIEVGGVRFTGSVDRIDVASNPDTGEAYLSVLDYKSGNSTSLINGAKLIERHSVQVPIYLIAASRALGMTPAFGGYVGYKSSKTSYLASKQRLGAGGGGALDDDEFDGLLEDLELRVGETFERMRSGDIAPVADKVAAKYSDCKYCANWWCPNHPKGEQW